MTPSLRPITVHYSRLDDEPKALEMLAILEQVGGDLQEAVQELSPESLELLQSWPGRRANVRAEEYCYQVRGREIRGHGPPPAESAGM